MKRIQAENELMVGGVGLAVDKILVRTLLYNRCVEQHSETGGSRFYRNVMQVASSSIFC